MTFAEYIKEKREKMGKTQKELAKALGLSPSTICLWESGKSVPRTDEHQKVIKLYRMTQEEVTTLLNSSIVLNAEELNMTAKKERTVILVHAANDFKNNNDINVAVRNIEYKMGRDGWAVVSAQTTMAMYYNVRGFCERTIQWCTTLVFER